AVHVGEGIVGRSKSYGWAHVRQGSHHMLWLQRFVDPAGTPSRRMRIVDAVDLGPVDDGYALQAEGCGPKGGAQDAEIVGLVHYVGEEGADAPRRGEGDADA